MHQTPSERVFSKSKDFSWELTSLGIISISLKFSMVVKVFEYGLLYVIQLQAELVELLLIFSIVKMTMRICHILHKIPNEYKPKSVQSCLSFD